MAQPRTRTALLLCHYVLYSRRCGCSRLPFAARRGTPPCIARTMACHGRKGAWSERTGAWSEGTGAWSEGTGGWSEWQSEDVGFRRLWGNAAQDEGFMSTDNVTVFWLVVVLRRPGSVLCETMLCKSTFQAAPRAGHGLCPHLAFLFYHFGGTTSSAYTTIFPALGAASNVDFF